MKRSAAIKLEDTMQAADELPARFALSRADEPPVRVVVVLGEVDVATAPELKAELASLEGSDPVVVDLCDTAFMDSSGVHVLLSAQAVHSGRLLVACAPTGAVQRVIELAAAGMLSIHPDRSTAVAAALA